MTPIQQFQILVDKMPSLALAVSQLLEGKEKHWGCFKVRKGEDRVYQLYIPSLPILKLKLSGNHTYRAFWGDNNRSSVYTKQEQKILTSTTSELAKRQRTKSESTSQLKFKTGSRSQKNGKKSIILSGSKVSSERSSQKPELVTMKQNIYQIVYYQSSPTPEIDIVNKMIAGFLREKIEKVTSESQLAPDEIMPLVLMTARA